MAIGPIGAAAIVESISEIGKKVFSDIMGKAAVEAGKVVEKKVIESLGGKGTIDDEIAYERLEAEDLTPEERLILEEFRQMKRASFGTKPKDEETYKDWDNDFRQSVLKRRFPGSSKPATKTVKKKDGTVTTTEEDKGAPANKQPAIDFLKRFAAHMKIERDKWRSKEKKRAAGFAAGQAYLDNYNLPSDRHSALGQQVKKVVSEIPGDVKGAYIGLKGHVGKKVAELDDWIQCEHAKLPVEPTSPNIAADSPRQRARKNR
jgi:hypothetical protein